MLNISNIKIPKTLVGILGAAAVSSTANGKLADSTQLLGNSDYTQVTTVDGNTPTFSDGLDAGAGPNGQFQLDWLSQSLGLVKYTDSLNSQYAGNGVTLGGQGSTIVNAAAQMLFQYDATSNSLSQIALDPTLIPTDATAFDMKTYTNGMTAIGFARPDMTAQYSTIGPGQDWTNAANWDTTSFSTQDQNGALFIGDDLVFLGDGSMGFTHGSMPGYNASPQTLDSSEENRFYSSFDENVPEPGSASLALLGAGLLAAGRRRPKYVSKE